MSSDLILLLGTVVLFAGGALALVTIGGIVRDRSQVSASLATINAIGGPVPTEMVKEYDKPFRERVTEPVLAWATRVARRISGADWPTKARRKLDLAGAPDGWDIDRLLAVKALGALLSGALIGALFLGDGIQMFIWGTVALVVGFFLPEAFLSIRIDRRTEATRRALPDSIDLLTVSVEAGLAFDAALAQVAHDTDGPLAEEFTRVLHEIQIGSSRADALRGLAERTDVDELRIFLNSMVQAEKLGVPVADVLRVQAAEMRLKRSQYIEEKAAKLPVKIVFPVMLGIMPSIFIVILGSAAISIFDALGSV